MVYKLPYEPITPEVKPPRPPWIGKFTGREYKYRPEWWADIDYKDEALRSGKFRGFFYSLKENDHMWFDPKVEDGTSLAGPFGLDSKYHPDITKKGDQVGNLFEFQRKAMENSTQYKQIAEKWQISKEHPGIDVNPNLDSVNHTKYNWLGTMFFLPNSWHFYGPRFWDKPMNEGCFEKGVCCAKYTAIFAIPYTLFHLKAYPPPNMPVTWNHTTVLKRYLSFLPAPCLSMFAYGVGLCTAANLRNKDDCWNYLGGSVALGLTFGTIKENPRFGSIVFFVSYVIGLVNQYARTHFRGVQGNVIIQELGGIHSGPLTWKLFNFGDKPKPEEIY